MLGVSVTTVSKALRGLPDIGPATRQQVLEAAQSMNYKPNPIALSLVKNETRTIGVIIPSFTIPFYASAISGIQKKASEQGYQIMICQSGESYDMEIQSVQTLLNSRVDGLVVSLASETTQFDHFQSLIDQGIPLVLFNRVCEDLLVSKVVVDDYAGAYNAVKHLVEIGCRRIAHIAGPDGLLLSKNRRLGYETALRDAGQSVQEKYILPCDFSIEQGKSISQAFMNLPMPPDAIFAVCDSAAFGAISTCRMLGLSVPRDMAIVGFTDEPVASYMDPSLTTVAQPTFLIGELAAEMLLNQIASGEPFVPAIRTLPTSLILRQSTSRVSAAAK